MTREYSVGVGEWLRCALFEGCGVLNYAAVFSPNQAIAICAMGKRLAVPLKCVRGKQLAVPLRRVRGKSAVKVVTEVEFQDCA